MTARREILAIIGAGRLAQTMALAFAGARGLRVVVAARRPEAAAKLARKVKTATAAPIEEAVANASIVLLAVPDRSIAPLARALAPLRPSWEGVVALHGAGAYGPELLSAFSSRGAATGVFHPLAVLRAVGSSTLSGAFVRIEGKARAAAAARRLAGIAGLFPLPARGLKTPRARRAYHAAASLASNDVVALLYAAQRLLVRHRVPKRTAWRAVVSLASGALAAAVEGAGAALTGPVARNDVATLRRQLAALASADRDARDAHRALSSILVDLARRSGRLRRTDAAGLRRVLARGRSGKQRV